MSVWTRRLLFLLPGTTLAAEDDIPAEFAGLPGQPVVALAQHPAVGPRLRVVARGRQKQVSDTLRGTGPGMTWQGGWIAGWARLEEHRVFLGYNPRSEQLAVMLWVGNTSSLSVPPLMSPWPEGLREAMKGFNPQLEGQMRWE
jgi:hypothetical protein